MRVFNGADVMELTLKKQTQKHFLAVPCDMRDPGSPTWDGTLTLIGTEASRPPGKFLALHF